MRTVIIAAVIALVGAVAQAQQLGPAFGQPARPRTIRESISRYAPDHSRSLAQVPPPPPGPGPKGFPWRTMLIGVGIGCGVGVAFVQAESEGHGHHARAKLAACGYVGAIAAFAVIVH